MARLRLFGPARDAAGVPEAAVEGTTVEEVLRAACVRYGAGFSSVLDCAKVWVNGEPAPGGTAVGPTDEVAVLPPVSGG